MSTETTYAWLTGSGCCGSSLVQELLSRHRDVAFLTNIEDRVNGRASLGRAGSVAFRRTPQWLTVKGRVRLAPSEGYRALSAQVSPLVSHPVGPLTQETCDPWLVERFREFFRARAEGRAEPLFLHKFTGHSRVGLVEAAFPRSRHVHVVRDGRAVAASLVKQSWWTSGGGVADAWRGLLPPADVEAWESSDRSPAVFAALVWQQTVREHEQAAGPVGDRWTDLRYEDLLREPEERIGGVLRHLGLEDDDVLTTVLRGYRFHTSRAAAYERELSPRTVSRIEEAVGPTLARYGYR